MAVFDVCAAITIAPGGSFQWTNSKAHAVKITPASGSWPLPQSEYDLQAGATTQPITLPTTAAYGTYQITVAWQSASSPGVPCSAVGANPKIVVSNTKPSAIAS